MMRQTRRLPSARRRAPWARRWEDGTASTVGFFQKIFGGFSWTKPISAAILLVVCGVLIKLILKATDRMLGRSRLDKAVHPFIRTIVKLVLLFTAIMLIAGTLGVDTSSLLALLERGGAGRVAGLAECALQHGERGDPADDEAVSDRALHRDGQCERHSGQDRCDLHRHPHAEQPARPRAEQRDHRLDRDELHGERQAAAGIPDHGVVRRAAPRT